MAAFRNATQENRPIKITSPFGDNALLFYRMSGSERLGGLFEYELEMLSKDPDLDPKKILGKQITISVDPLPGATTQTRYFNSYVCRFGQYGTVNEFNFYRATLRPWLWLLTRTTNCRIFQQKTVPDIIKQVFTDYGFSDFECKISGYPTHEYCVQYRESSFNFISRLMEEEGIYYYFKHEQGKHTLIMADGLGSHTTVSGYEDIPFIDAKDSRKGAEHISSWGFEQEVQTGIFTLTDYDFKKPNSSSGRRCRFG